MNQLVQSIIQPFTEAQMKSVALVPGGYKPPTSGHFYLVNEMAKRSEINEVIVLIGHKVRDGITAEQSLAIWEIYKKHLPSNVTIHIAEAKSDADKAQLNRDIEQMVKTLPKFDTLDSAKQKINTFLA